MLYTHDIEEIEMDLTGTCNLKCPLCTRNYVHAQHLLTPNIRPMHEIIDQLDKFTSLKRFFIAGAVSEPTLHPEFIDFIQYLVKRHIYFELFTNGNTHNTEWWKMLGNIVPPQCMVCFTVCGSTQELHEKYRVGSSLQQILDNAAAFRTANKNDWVQFIQFEYNTSDLKSGKLDSIFSQFSNVMIVQSEGQRRLNLKCRTFSSDIRPTKLRNSIINKIFKDRLPINSNICIQCKSLRDKKIYIDQFGRITTCYIHAEFEDDWFEDNIDYTKILKYNYPDCYLCSSIVNDYIQKFNMEFIC